MKIVLINFLLILICIPSLCARINFIEFYKPGVDTQILKLNTYDLSINTIIGSGGKPKDTFKLPAVFSCSLAEKLELGMLFGIVSYAAETGISDIDLGVKYLLNHQPNIAGEFGLSLPTGDYKKGLGPGAMSIIFNLPIQMKISVINAHFSLGYKIYTENPDRVKKGNELVYIIGGEYPLKKDIVVFGEIKGINHAPNIKYPDIVTKSGYQEVYLAPGIKYNLDKMFDLYSSLLLGLTEDSHNIILFIGMKLNI